MVCVDKLNIRSSNWKFDGKIVHSTAWTFPNEKLIGHEIWHCAASVRVIWALNVQITISGPFAECADPD